MEKQLYPHLLPSEGEAADSRRVIEVITNVLSTDTEEAKELLALDHDPDRALDPTRGDFPGHFAALAKKNERWPQWIGTLLPLEFADGFEENPYSTLKFLESANNHERILKHGELRREFIERMCQLVRDDELENYHHLLAPRPFNGSTTDDAGALHLVNLVEEIYVNAYAMQEAWLFDNHYPEDQPLPERAVKNVCVEVSKQVGILLDDAMRGLPGAEKDSLASRVILNSAANRGILELDEFDRLQNEAFHEVDAVVRLLNTALPSDPLPVNPEADLTDQIDRFFVFINSPETEAGDKPRIGAREQSIITNRARLLIDEYIRRRSLGREQEFRALHGNPHNKLLMTACLAWAFYSQQKHHLRIVGAKHPERLVIHSRSRIDELDIPDSMVANLMRQYGLLFYSNQHIERSIFNLNDYHIAANVKRHMLRRLFVQLKSASLPQWDAALLTLEEVLKKLQTTSASSSGGLLH